MFFSEMAAVIRVIGYYRFASQDLCASILWHIGDKVNSLDGGNSAFLMGIS